MDDLQVYQRCWLCRKRVLSRNWHGSFRSKRFLLIAASPYELRLACAEHVLLDSFDSFFKLNYGVHATTPRVGLPAGRRGRNTAPATANEDRNTRPTGRAVP